MRFRDRRLLSWYLLRLRLLLDGRVPQRSVRGVLGEVRANTLAAAEHSSMPAALRSLGPAGQLARSFAEGFTDRPRWLRGLGAGLAVLVALVLTAMVCTIVFGWGVAAGGGRPGEHSYSILGLLEGSYQESDRGLTAAGGTGPPGLLLALLVAVCVARPWVLRRRTDAARNLG
jgi:hypothetical protein